jgi:hypothetical protein
VFYTSADAAQLGEVYDEGAFFADRLLIGGAGQISEDDFLAAFPGVRLVR